MTEVAITGLSVVEEMQARVALILNGEDDGWRPAPIANNGGRKIGEATPEQRALYRLYYQMGEEHQHMHNESGLPFGALTGIDETHQKVHVLMQLAKITLLADLTFAFPQIYQRPFEIDSDWSIYLRNESLFEGPEIVMVRLF